MQILTSNQFSTYNWQFLQKGRKGYNGIATSDTCAQRVTLTAHLHSVSGNNHRGYVMTARSVPALLLAETPKVIDCRQHLSAYEVGRKQYRKQQQQVASSTQKGSGKRETSSRKRALALSVILDYLDAYYFTIHKLTLIHTCTLTR